MRWFGVLALIASVVGCRSGDSCEGTQCVDAGCRTDAECDDGLGCNGKERCDGRCVAGTPVECEDELVCAERGGATACVYRESSPWYVYIGDDYGDAPLGLLGIRQADMGRAPPVLLSDAVATDEYLGPTWFEWSPDGRFLVFDLTDAEFRGRLFFVEFGAGPPSVAKPLPDLPFGDGWDPDVTWSAGSETAVVREDADVYFIDFRGGEPTTSLLTAEGTVLSAEPCADGETVTFWTEDDPGPFIATAPALLDAEPLGESEWMSPDGTRLMVEGEDGLWTSECGIGKPRQSHELPARADDDVTWPAWSPDSRFFALPTLDADDVSGLAVIDALGETEMFATAAIAETARWGPTDPRLLFASASSEELTLATFPGGEVSTVGVPVDAVNPQLHAAGVSYGLYDEATDTGSDWLRLEGSNEPLELEGCENAGPVFDVGPSRAACIQRGTDGHFAFIGFAVDGTDTVTRTRLQEPSTEELLVEAFSPDGAGFVAARQWDGDRWFRTILWVAGPFEAGMPLLPVNIGAIGYYGSWQPTRSEPSAKAQTR